MGSKADNGQRVDKAIGAIYDSAASPDLWPVALDAIADCFDSVGTVLMMQRPDLSMTTIVSQVLEPAAREYEAGAWKLDFTVARALERGTTAAEEGYSDRHLATPEEIATHPFYTEFRRRHGLGPFLGGQVSPFPDMPVILTIQGKPDRPTFDDDEIATFRILGRHAERALRLTIMLEEAKAEKLALGDALSRLACGAFLVDGEGKVLFANETARAANGHAVVLQGGRLMARHAAERPALAEAVSSAARLFGWMGVEALRPVILSGGRTATSKLIAYVLPIRPRGGDSELLFARDRVLILLLDPGSPKTADPAVVRDLLGLTLGEAKLAALIGSGKSPREAATGLGITEESARTVLKRVFAKVGVSRQSELAALLARLVTDGGGVGEGQAKH